MKAAGICNQADEAAASQSLEGPHVDANGLNEFPTTCEKAHDATAWLHRDGEWSILLLPVPPRPIGLVKACHEFDGGYQLIGTAVGVAHCPGYFCDHLRLAKLDLCAPTPRREKTVDYIGHHSSYI